MSTPPSKDWSSTVAWALGISLMLGMVALIVVVWGGVTREEFSPGNFQRRESTYYRIPIVQLQVTPVLRKSTTNSLEHHLIQKGRVKPAGNTKTVPWDLVELRSLSTSDRFGDAAVLCRYLDARDAAGDLFWRQWSRDHPELSATLWPLVAFVARAGAYQAVPEMFQAALNHTVAKELDAELRTGLSETFADMERYHAARREVNEAKAAQLLGQRLQSNSHIDAATDDARPAKGNG